MRITTQITPIPVTGTLEGSALMAGQCQVCGKTTTFGHNVSFSKRRTNRKFKANVHRKRLTVEGIEIRVNICTRCMRTLAKPGKA
jgi:large subunit ribosomal protein L28